MSFDTFFKSNGLSIAVLVSLIVKMSSDTAGSVTPCHAALLPGTDKVVTVTTSVRDDRSTLSHHPKKIIITLIAIIFIQLLALVFLIHDKIILSEKMIQDNSSAHRCDQNFDSLTG